ncbi:MAG: tetratricopeptide repeat protein [Candidatus Riflebacteria bacterium]|nr:tetratricopeptide repeat protein [Candidatus Riflebacteria bacterium]
MKKSAIIPLVLAGLIVTSSDIDAAPKKKKAAGTKKQSIEAIETKGLKVSEAYYSRAWKKFRIGSTKEKNDVIEALKKIIKKSESEHMAHYYLGIMTTELGEDKEGLKHFNNALLYLPNSADILTRIGEIYDRQGKSKEALEHFNKALSINQMIPTALSRVGKDEYEKGNITKALNMLLKAREMQPENPETLRTLGKIYLAEKRGSEAEEILSQAILFDEKHAETQLDLAKSYDLLNNSNKASEHYALAKKLGKKNEEIIGKSGYSLARNLYLSGKIEEAEKEYKKALKTLEDKASGYYGLAEIYESLGREDDAIKHYIKAYNEDKKYADKIMSAAEIYIEREEYDNAKSTYELLRRDPVYKEKARAALSELKTIKEETEKRQLEQEIRETGSSDADIESNYLALYDYDKNNTEAIEGLMNYYNDRGYYDEALKWFRRYNKINPTSSQDKKLIEKGYKEKLEQDNYRLYGEKSPKKVTKSSLSDDEIHNIAFSGENDRLQETALKILLTRKDYKSDSSVHHKLLRFYTERGNRKEALKCVSKMKRLGILSESESDSIRDELRKK